MSSPLTMVASVSENNFIKGKWSVSAASLAARANRKSPVRTVAGGDQRAFSVGIPRRSNEPSIRSSCTRVAVCKSSTAAPSVTVFSRGAPSIFPTSRLRVGRMRLPPAASKCSRAARRSACDLSAWLRIRSSTSFISSVTGDRKVTAFKSVSPCKEPRRIGGCDTGDLCRAF